MVMEYLFMGILPEDFSGKRKTVETFYSDEQGYTVSPIPNLNMNRLQHVFGNSATNSQDYEEQRSKVHLIYPYE